MPKNMKVKTEFTASDRMTSQMNKMERGMNRFGRATLIVGRALRATGRALRAFGAFSARWIKRGAIAAIGGLTALGYSINRVTADMDKLAKTGRALSFPIEELQEWEFVANQSGLSTDEFRSGLERFTKNFSEMKIGMGTMNTALKKVNPTLYKQMKSTESSAEAFDIYIKAMRGARTETERNILATAAFGRGGMKMGLLAIQSAEGVEELRKQMRENGIVTAAQAAAAEKFQDSLNRTKMSIGSLVRDALTPLIPKANEIIDRIGAWSRANRDMIKMRVAEWIEKAERVIRDLIVQFREAWPEIKRVALEVFEFVKKLPGFIRLVWDLRGAIAAFGLAMAGIKLASFAGGLMGVADSLGRVAGNAGTAAANVGKLGGLLKGAGLVGAAGAAGFAVGSVIQKLIIEPNQRESGSRAERLSNQSVLLDRDLATGKLAGMSEDELSSRRRKIQTDLDQAGVWNKVWHSSELADARASISLLDKALEQRRTWDQSVAREREWADDFASLSGERGGAPFVAPQVTETRTENVTTEKIEMIIRDESGRAQVVRGGSSGNLTYQVTGAMP